MAPIATALHSLVRVLGVVLVVLGVLFWVGIAYGLISIHIALGFILVFALWGLAGIAARSKAHPLIVGLTVAWGFVVILLGLRQQEILPGGAHWVVRVLHLAVGFAAVTLAGTLTSGITTRARPTPASAKVFRMPPFLRLGNAVVTTLLRLGVNLGPMALITVRGRKSGRPRTTPVAVGEWNGQRWLIAPYGEVDWVRNLRAAGCGTLARGRRVEGFRAVELAPAAAAPILKRALVRMPAFLRSYFAVTPTSSLEEFEREALRHPVFQLEPPTLGAAQETGEMAAGGSLPPASGR